MADKRTARALGLFWEALNVPGEDRPGVLQRCEDAAVRQEVELLLAQVHGAAPSDPPAIPWTTRALHSTETAQELQRDPEQRALRIGPYHVKRVIASGGMGIVYEALQESPRRTVALKVMKSSIATPSALRRFEYEAQILARLRHPGIAQIYEFGAQKDTGEPYFVMEYVPNARTITSFAAEHHLDTARRLELFEKVGDAVHHGHQKGIVHRDLKPGNILVDSEGQPKIIDFGVARATDSDLAVTTLQTRVGQLVGTLQYMSPEQISADPHDIDTRSDVYSLGLVLYELLCGELPYRVSQAALFEATRIIREESPATLSRFDDRLRGDLEAIVMKALEKDRQHRYQSVNGLIADLRRYRNNEPVSARAPTLGYHVRVFARRHRRAVLATAGVAVALIAATVISVVSAVDAHRARGQEARALARLQAIDDFFLREVFGAADPDAGLGKDPTIHQAIDRAAAGVAQIGDAVIEAAVRARIGRVYMVLEEFEASYPHLARALELRESNLGPDAPETAESLFLMGMHEHYVGHYEQAEDYARRAVDDYRRLAPGSDDLGEALQLLGTTLKSRGHKDQARAALDEALQIFTTAGTRDRPRVAQCLTMLGHLHRDAQELPQAEAAYREALQISRRHRPEEHLKNGQAMSNLGYVLSLQGRWAEAEPMLRRGCEILDRHYDEHTELAMVQVNLGMGLAQNDRAGEAVSFLERALATYERQLGEEHLYTARIRIGLAVALTRAGDCQRAIEQFALALQVLEHELGAAHWQTANVHSQIGECNVQLGRLDQARRELDAAGAVLLKDAAVPAKARQMHLRRLRDLARAQGDEAEAERIEARLEALDNE